MGRGIQFWMERGVSPGPGMVAQAMDKSQVQGKRDAKKPEPYNPKKTLPGVFEDREEAIAWVTNLKKYAVETPAPRLAALDNLKKGHPRLIILNDEIGAIQNRLSRSEHGKRLLKNMKEKAEAIIGEKPVSFDASEDGNYLRVSRTALKRITTLAGLYLICRDRRYAERARLEMLSAADKKSWNPVHFLDVAEMTAALSLGYDWLYEELSPGDREKIKKAIIDLGLKPGLREYELHKWWTYSPFNWNLVCNGGMTLGALAIADEEPELASRILNCTKISVPFAMATFAPDGGWPEGAGYWCYGTKYAMFMLSALNTALGEDNGWSKLPGFSKTGFFRIHYTSPTKRYFNFADSSDEERRASQMFWLAKKFQQPIFAGAELDTAGNITDIFHLLFYPDRSITTQAKNSGLSRAHLFKGINTGFYRSNWTDKNALYLAFKGGKNSGGHAHLDQGTFILDWLSERWAMELGPDNYSLPGYFGNERFGYYRLATKGQNTLEINGRNQLVQASSPVTAFEDRGDKFEATMDLTEAYQSDTAPAPVISDRKVNITRTFKVLRAGGEDFCLELSDRIEGKKGESCVWHLHTDKIISLKSAARRALFSSRDSQRKLTAEILRPAGAQFTLSPIELSPKERSIKGVVDLQIHIPALESKTDLVVRFSPG